MVLDEFYISHVSAINYHMYKYVLCLDVYTESQEYSVLIKNDLKFVECYKTLVDCLLDFGQYASMDTETSEKPHGPFKKALDECTMGTSTTKTLKNWKPLLNDATRKQYWSGDGTYGSACFPGNLMVYIIDLDFYICYEKHKNPATIDVACAGYYPKAEDGHPSV